MGSNITVLDELASGEDEFDIDLMACGCRVAAIPSDVTPAPARNPIVDYLQGLQLDEEGLRQVVARLVEEQRIDDRTFISAVQSVVGTGAPA